MVICPIAIAVGCKKCPIFSVCPVKGIIGDYKKEDDAPAVAATGKTTAGNKPAARSSTKSGKKSGTRNSGKARAKRAK